MLVDFSEVSASVRLAYLLQMTHSYIFCRVLAWRSFSATAIEHAQCTQLACTIFLQLLRSFKMDFGKKTGEQVLRWLREEGFQENTIKIFEGIRDQMDG